MEQKHFSNDLIKFSSIYQDCIAKTSDQNPINEQIFAPSDPNEQYYQPVIKQIQPIVINPNRINYQPIVNRDRHHLQTIFNITIANWIATGLITFCYFLALLLWIYTHNQGWLVLSINLVATALWTSKWLISFAIFKPLQAINFYDQAIQSQWQKCTKWHPYPLINQIICSWFLKKAGKI